MKYITLLTKKRDILGKNTTNQLKRKNLIPAVLYGKNINNQHLEVKKQDILQLIKLKKEGMVIIKLKMNTRSFNSYLSIIKDIHYDYLKNIINHIDFQRILENDKIKLMIKIKFRGEPMGIKSENGILEILSNFLLIECYPKDIPEYLEIDISHLHAGESIHIKDIKVNNSIKLLGNKDVIIASCIIPANEISEKAETSLEENNKK